MTAIPAPRPTVPQRLSVGTFVLGTAYVSLAAGLLAWVVLPSLLLGLRPAVITSASMSPLIRTGDVVVYEPLDDPLELPVGTVVTFRDPVFDRLVTHRIVEVVEDGYVTRGDASPTDDSGVLTPDRVVGRGRLLIPFVGLPIAWMHERSVLLLAVWLLLTVGAVDRAWHVPGAVPEPQAEATPRPRTPRTPRRRTAPATTTRGATRAATRPAARDQSRRAARTAPSAATALRPVGLRHLLAVVTIAALVVAVPRSSAALAALASNVANAFEVGTWSAPAPTTYHLQSNGSWSTAAPSGATQATRLSPTDLVPLPTLTTTTAATLSGDTTVDLWVRRKGAPGPRTLHVALTWPGGPVLLQTLTAVPGNQPELWSFSFATTGLALPAGTPVVVLAELDATSAADLEIQYGSPAAPTGITFPDAVA